ncbi:Transposase, Rhodopirellula-type, partial [mine drainage metagenome]
NSLENSRIREGHGTGQGEAREVNVYDFPNLGMGKASPYGIYDTGRNEGMVNVGKSHDISKFAVESIRQWWLLMG